MSDVQYFRRNKLIVSPVRVISLCGHNGRVTWGRQGGRGLIRSDQLTAPRTPRTRGQLPPHSWGSSGQWPPVWREGTMTRGSGEQTVSGGGAENGSWSKCLCFSVQWLYVWVNWISHMHSVHQNKWIHSICAIILSIRASITFRLSENI